MEARGFPMGAYPVQFDEEVYAPVKAEIAGVVHRALDAFRKVMQEGKA